MHHRSPLIERLERLDAYDCDKVDILLAYVGLKPVSDIIIGTGKSPRKKVKKLKPSLRTLRTGQLLRLLCKDMGLVCRRYRNPIRGWNDHLFFAVGRHSNDVEKSLRYDKRIRRGALSLGRLLGYPDTASRAYAKGERFLVPIQNGRHGLPLHIVRQNHQAFAGLRFSKRHWKKEVVTIERWTDAVKKHDPPLYRRVVKRYRTFLKRKSVKRK